MQGKKKNNTVGVIVGRFQVPSLHEGHRHLFNTVLERHDIVYVFLGLSPYKGTIKNPLDFESRKQMILSEYPNVSIFYIKDVRSDEEWSDKLDEMIQDLLSPNQDVILYGSRDSFAEHYTGKFKVEIIEPKIIISGTEIRKEISLTVKSTPEFRKGVIWAVENRIPVCIPKVYAALINDEGNEILIARFKNEYNYELLGDTVQPSETLESCIRRVFNDKIKIEITGFKYIGSYFIDDWSLKNEVDKITGILFLVERVYGKIEPVREIRELRWINKVELNKLMLDKRIVPEQEEMFSALLGVMK